MDKARSHRIDSRRARRTDKEDFRAQALCMARTMAQDPMEETVWLTGTGYVLPGNPEDHERIALERLTSL